MLKQYQFFSSLTIRLIQNTIKYCHEYLKLPDNLHILLAISGGADSLAMACIFNYLSMISNYKISAITINHGLRDEAFEEVVFVKDFCDLLKINCAIEHFDANALAIKFNTGIENASRIGRYKLYEQYRVKYNADYIALAHHSHDLSEDVLMRLLRGCGWPALGGMKSRDDKRHIIRPLLWANPDELKFILSDLGISWMEDKSNFCLKFLRNRIRHNILPDMRKENPSFDKNVNRINEIAKIDEDYWDNIINELRLKKCWEKKVTSDTISVIFDKIFLKNLHKALRLRLYMYAINYLSNTICGEKKSQGRAETLFKLDKALLEGRQNKLFQFGNDLFATLKKNILYFSKKIENIN